MIKYKPTYFTIKELVHPWILRKIGEDNSWLRLDADALKDLDCIREAWGSEIYINRGAADSRGYRPPNDPDGSWNSTHKHGNTFDLVPKNGHVKGLYRMIYKMIANGQLKRFNTLENIIYTPTWVHVAVMNTSIKPLVIDV